MTTMIVKLMMKFSAIGIIIIKHLRLICRPLICQLRVLTRQESVMRNRALLSTPESD